MEGGPQTAPPSAAPSANGAGGSVVKGEGGRGGRKVKSAVQTGSSGSGGGKKAILSVPSPSVSSSSSGLSPSVCVSVSYCVSIGCVTECIVFECVCVLAIVLVLGVF